MRATIILTRGTLFLVSVMMLLTATVGCARAPAEVPSAREEGEIKQVAEVEADGLTLHYWRQSFWRKSKFSHYLANQIEFKADFKKRFEEGLAQSDVPVSASDYSFSADSTTQSTIARCDVHGAITKREADYRATFFWLLKPLGLDFIDNNFDGSETGLSWKGSISGIPTSITIKLPAINGSYIKPGVIPLVITMHTFGGLNNPFNP